MRIRPYNCCGEMNRLILGALLCVILAAPALAGPFEDALALIAADKRGDYETVLKLLRPLAEQGDDESQYNLGVMYEDGRGVPQDYTEAVKWWRLAADQGYDDAQDNLGVMYAHGNGVHRITSKRTSGSISLPHAHPKDRTATVQRKTATPSPRK